MPTVTPNEMAVRRDMLRHLPTITDFKLVRRGERYKFHFRLPDEPQGQYDHWFEGSIKEVRAAIADYGEELARRQLAVVDAKMKRG